MQYESDVDIDMEEDVLSPHDPLLDEYYESFEFATTSGNGSWLNESGNVIVLDKLRDLIFLAEHGIKQENYIDAAKWGRIFLEVLLKDYYDALLPDCIGISYVRMIDYCWGQMLIEQEEYDCLQTIRFVSGKGVCEDYTTSLSEVDQMVDCMKAEFDLFGYE